MPLTIWTNAKFNPNATKMLHEGVRGHWLVVSQQTSASVLAAGGSDPLLEKADIAFGQPDPKDCQRLAGLKWIEVTTAGYTRYDTPEFKEALKARNASFTRSSEVFADPCAQHVLGMMLALGRVLLPAYRDQLTDHSWRHLEYRAQCRLLTGQTVVMLGFGAIGRRLASLLAPFGMKIYAVRRSLHSEAGVHIVPEEQVSSVLAEADHVVNILPDSEGTRNYVNARRLACMRPTARFYNVGRGTTVDQKALEEALRSGKLAAAFLDVFEPEPLPVDHPLWTTPNCFITPHSAGGRHDQDETIVGHFLSNLAAFQKGAAMVDRVV